MYNFLHLFLDALYYFVLLKLQIERQLSFYINIFYTNSTARNLAKFINSDNFSIDSLEFSALIIISSINSDCFISFLPHVLSFSCFTVILPIIFSPLLTRGSDGSIPVMDLCRFLLLGARFRIRTSNRYIDEEK